MEHVPNGSRADEPHARAQQPRTPRRHGRAELPSAPRRPLQSSHRQAAPVAAVLSGPLSRRPSLRPACKERGPPGYWSTRRPASGAGQPPTPVLPTLLRRSRPTILHPTLPSRIAPHARPHSLRCRRQRPAARISPPPSAPRRRRPRPAIHP